MRNPLHLLPRSKAVRGPTIVTEPSVRILNYDEGLNTDGPKRALLSYLSQPVLDELNGGKSVRFSNDGIATSWPKVLTRLGYAVDIINWDDNEFTFNQPYDLVISHGGINYESIAKQLNPETKYIYFSTGSYWKFHNEQENKRFRGFAARHGVELPSDRYIDHPEEEANRRADAIICLGNKAATDTYKGFDNVFNLPIGSFTTSGHVKSIEEIELGRHDILFIAGAGNIHKGLDLVLDALVDMPEYTLHIYTFMDTSFSKFYKKQLAQDNVKIYDFEAFPNRKFIELARKCNTVIMPSCSEGSPGSITESIIQGLIPIVSKEAHIDVDDFGVLLSDNSVKTIRGAIDELSTLPSEVLANKSRLANHTGLKRHSQAAYEASLQAIMGKIEKKR